MQNEEVNGKSPFTRYREGYVDGYRGHPRRMLQDDIYSGGYDDGRNDDRFGMEDRYPEDPSPVQAASLKLPIC